MVKRCVVQFCGNSNLSGHSVHTFPKDPVLRRQWTRFVNIKRKDFKFPSDKSQAVICGEHFAQECFEGSVMFGMGFKSKRTLQPGAVPTIQPVPTTEQLARAQHKAKKRPSSSASPRSVTPGTIVAGASNLVSATPSAPVDYIPEVPPKRQSRAIHKLEVNRVGVLTYKI